MADSSDGLSESMFLPLLTGVEKAPDLLCPLSPFEASVVGDCFEVCALVNWDVDGMRQVLEDIGRKWLLFCAKQLVKMKP